MDGARGVGAGAHLWQRQARDLVRADGDDRTRVVVTGWSGTGKSVRFVDGHGRESGECCRQREIDRQMAHDWET